MCALPNDWDFGPGWHPSGVEFEAMTTARGSETELTTSFPEPSAERSNPSQSEGGSGVSVDPKFGVDMGGPHYFVTKDSGAKDTFPSGYQRDCSAGKGAHNLLPFFALTRDAKLYERGAAKYGPDNWTKGAPFSRTMQSVIRHVFQYMMGDRSEDHLAAARWGLAAIMTYEEMIARGLLPRELDDLPRYEAKNAH